ncbi:dbino protein [Hordeum vulgare]|nr:dbino protein [Hordeum vulgare]
MTYHYSTTARFVDERDAVAFQSLKAFKARHKNKSFTLTHYWSVIKDCLKFRYQYAALMKKKKKKKKGKASAAENEEVMPKRSKGKTNLKIDEKCDAASFAMQETLQVMMTQKEV